jgi:hypothetical protein
MSSSSQRLTGRSLRLASYSKRSSTPAPTPSKKRHSDDDAYDDDDDDSLGGKGKLPRASKKPRAEGAGSSSSGGGGGQAEPLVIRDDTGRRAYTFDTSLRCRLREFVQAKDGLDIERAQVRGESMRLGWSWPALQLTSAM